jgi:beta-lactamase class A
MSIAPLRQPRRRLPVLRLLSGGLLFAALILLAIEIVNFARSRNVKQDTVLVAGIPAGGLTVEDAQQLLECTYAQPVELRYGDNPIQLAPEAIGFHVNSEIMTKAFSQHSSTSNSIVAEFWQYLWRQESAPVSIDLSATYDVNTLRNFLIDIASRYDVQNDNVSFNSQTLVFETPNDYQALDIEASLPEIEAALKRPTNRSLQLVMKPVASARTSLEPLQSAIRQYLQTINLATDGPDTFVSAVVIDLASGLEMSINPDVAYSSQSTIKIPILLNYFRTLSQAPETGIKFLMAASILCSNNDASNNLIQYSADNSAMQDRFITGLQNIISTMQTLGAKNTYISAPIDVGDPTLRFSIGKPTTTPDKRFDAQPDPFSQTTASDMATLLFQLYDCAEYGSGLRAAYPNEFTQAECKQLIELLSGNIIGHMIELGVPEGSRVAHKNGWGAYGAGYNDSDAAIIYTPGGNYVLVVYIWERLAEGHQIGSLLPWQAIETISRITYNYYNPQTPLLENRRPDNPELALGCVMPNNAHPERIDLNNIRNGRFDSKGKIVADACYDWPACQPIPEQKVSLEPPQ